MQATLIYNENAGVTANVSAEELEQALRSVGYDPVSRSPGTPEELDAILAEIQGLVIAAGGDGTARSVATRLLNKNLPLAILPLGTANNVSNALGIAIPPLDIIAGLVDPRRMPFDIGVVHFPWGQEHFIEGVGFGFFADILATYDPEEGKSVLRSVDAILDTLPDYEADYYEMTLDGEDISGEYLMVEIFNTKAVGPRLRLAPEASPTDGAFHVVRLQNDERDGFLAYAQNYMDGEVADLCSAETVQGKKLELTWSGFPLHVDDKVRPPDQDAVDGTTPTEQNQKETTITIEVIPDAVELWLPPEEQES
jgi:diacylglycerol kinase family enzyme